MTTPVVVSRIQNRRGTQAQFDNLYPPTYTGVGGFNPPGTGPAGYNSTAYPNTLLPGELALCTDSRRIFVGNLNGEYEEVRTAPGSDITFAPVIWTLAPSVGYIPITRTLPGPTTVTLEYEATPFFSILYSVTDSVAPDWNTVGTSFSRNAELKITAVTDFAPIPNPPFPDIVSVSMVDDGSEVNLTAFELHFRAQYNGSRIELLYKHNFPGSLTFGTGTISWASI